MITELIKIYCDGSSRGNPGPAGWGVVALMEEDIIYHRAKFYDRETNNRMELEGMKDAIKLALLMESDPLLSGKIVIYSDSAYVVNICNNWMFSWRQNGWLRSKNQSIENLDIIKDIYNLITNNPFKVKIKKIPGHSNIIGNELADALATNNINKWKTLIKENNLAIFKS